MERHNFSFFGQKSALFLDSGSLNEPAIYIRLIKKLPSGTWEKPSRKEGKSIKFNLLEMTEILHVLHTPNSSWSTVHRFKQQQTSIKFDHKEATLQMFATGYSKFFNRAEIRVFRDLLTHIYKEKIQFATGNNEKYNNKQNVKNNEKYHERHNESYLKKQNSRSNPNQFSPNPVREQTVSPTIESGSLNVLEPNIMI